MKALRRGGWTCEARDTMRTKAPNVEMYERTLTLLRAAKSREYKYSPGGREKRRTRPIPSLPKLSFADKGDQSPEWQGAVGGAAKSK